MTADGKYLINAAGGPISFDHYAHAIDHVTRTVSSAGVLFWNLCGDHGDTVSASNGKTYYVTFECYDVGGVWRVDVSQNIAGRTRQQVRDANQQLIKSGFTMDGHFSGVSKGAFADWVFFSSETNSDNFNSSAGSWVSYGQEIIAINVVTLETRRLAHHRSRGLGLASTSYPTYPRVSSSWDGSVVMWASNFNISSPTGYADLYAIQSPLNLSAPVPIPPPSNLKVQ